MSSSEVKPDRTRLSWGALRRLSPWNRPSALDSATDSQSLSVAESAPTAAPGRNKSSSRGQALRDAWYTLRHRLDNPPATRDVLRYLAVIERGLQKHGSRAFDKLPLLVLQRGLEQLTMLQSDDPQSIEAMHLRVLRLRLIDAIAQHANDVADEPFATPAAAVTDVARPVAASPASPQAVPPARPIARPAAASPEAPHASPAPQPRVARPLGPPLRHREDPDPLFDTSLRTGVDVSEVDIEIFDEALFRAGRVAADTRALLDDSPEGLIRGAHGTDAASRTRRDEQQRPAPSPAAGTNTTSGKFEPPDWESLRRRR